MLTMRNIGSVHQLEFFVNHISLYVYQANLSLAPPDMAFIEGLLQNDLLEGDMDWADNYVHQFEYPHLPQLKINT